MQKTEVPVTRGRSGRRGLVRKLPRVGRGPHRCILRPHAGELRAHRVHRPAQLLLGVDGGDEEAEAGGVLRDGGVHHRVDVDAVAGEEPLGEADALEGVADDDRDDGGVLAGPRVARTGRWAEKPSPLSPCP